MSISVKSALISEDKADVGEQELIFNHQMIMDLEKRTIYRILVRTR